MDHDDTMANAVARQVRVVSSDSLHALPPDTQLFDFKVERVIGEGGFSIVYLALDQSLQRRIAIKEYLPRDLAFRRSDGTVSARSPKHQEAFEAGREGFLEEARLLAKFEHPALIRVIRYWEANGTAYIATFYYPGVTLRELLKAERACVTESSLKALLHPLLDAVEMLHAKQCFHRDIAPDNIIVQPNGCPVLLDFGAARRIIGDMTHALTAVIKPGYAPLEQYAEEGGLVQGPWTDVYAFAALLYWAIVGSPPAASVARAIKDSLAPLQRNPPAGYGVDFLRAIDRGLSVRPEDRPQSIAEFRQELGFASEPDCDRTILIERPISAGTPASPKETRPSNPRLTVGAGARASPQETRLSNPRLTVGAGARASTAPLAGVADTSRVRVAGAWRKGTLAAGLAALIAVTVALVIGFRDEEPDDTHLAKVDVSQDASTTATNQSQTDARVGGDEAQPSPADPLPSPPSPAPGLPSARASHQSPPPTDVSPPPLASGQTQTSPKIGTSTPDRSQPSSPPLNEVPRQVPKADTPSSRQVPKDPTRIGKAKDPVAGARPRAKPPQPSGPVPGRIASDSALGTEADAQMTLKAEPADAKGQFELATSYARGVGVKQDNAAAVKWFRKSAEQGYAPAQNRLGLIYYNGFGGVQQDQREAANWYLRAAAQGDANAQMSLGFMYANGIGVLKDEAAAIGWYRKSAEQGNAFAQNHLGDMLATGRGVGKDATEAAQWYRKAAEVGNNLAQASLGRMYETGAGVTSSSVEARKWYSLAAAKGNVEAAQRLKALDQAAAK